jgi:signal transduction histidine kinase
VQEPAEFAKRGFTNIHKDTWPEVTTVLFFGLMPMLLALGWWWMRRVLGPLLRLTRSLEQIQSDNLREPLPRSMNGDEVDQLSAAFNSMIERLDKAFRHIHAFSLGASHELKTPLTVMRGQLETMLREEEGRGSKDKTDWIVSQLDEVKRLTKIVESLSLVTRADIGQITLKLKPVQLGELVSEMVQDAEILAQSRGVTIVSSLEADPWIDGDCHRLRQLLFILTDNALKYNRPQGRLQFSLTKTNDRVGLEVTNTIAGKPPENMETLFDPFIRGREAAVNSEGSGLGLSIARWIVQAHQGQIRLLSGDGQTVTVSAWFPQSRATSLQAKSAE